MTIVPTWGHNRAWRARPLTDPAEEQAVSLYREMERHRAAMRKTFDLLLKHIEAHPTLRHGWQSFLANGKATSGELRECLHHKHEYARRKAPGLLRLVSRGTAGSS